MLFDTIDAIIGDPLLAFGGQNPSSATATMLDTTVNASGAARSHCAGPVQHHLDHQQHDHGLDEPR